jgi:hypothetical protein
LKRFGWLGILFATVCIVLGTAGCGVLLPTADAPVVDASSLETPTATRTVIPSRTPVWFPATETPTTPPTAAPRPTEDFRPGVGAVLLSDDFSNHSGWQTLKNENGRVSFGKNELTLAVSIPKGALFSFRAAPLPADFYLEITVNPSLCRANDSYGLLLRAQSERDGYRLLANCGGALRMERLVHGQMVVEQDWTPSGEIPPGGMLPVRLGVWAQGKDLRVFVNDVYQFSMRDPVFSSGQLGILARSAEDTPLTVSFSGLQVHALDLSRIPTVTPQPTETPEKP